MYKYETMRAFDMSGMILGWAIIIALVLLAFSSFTIIVYRRTLDKTVTGSYSVMLLIALIGYITISYKASSSKSNKFRSKF